MYSILNVKRCKQNIADLSDPVFILYVRRQRHWGAGLRKKHRWSIVNKNHCVCTWWVDMVLLILWHFSYWNCFTKSSFFIKSTLPGSSQHVLVVVCLFFFATLCLWASTNRVVCMRLNAGAWQRQSLRWKLSRNLSTLRLSLRAIDSFDWTPLIRKISKSN